VGELDALLGAEDEGNTLLSGDCAWDGDAARRARTKNKKDFGNEDMCSSLDPAWPYARFGR
jgi:hypothetical protein